jgi:glucokinase
MKINMGIDVGGTKVLVLVLDDDYNILSRAKGNTLKGGATPEETCGAIKNLADDALEKAGAKWSDIIDLGVAVPTSIDPQSGEAFLSPALGWKNIPIRKIMSKALGRELFIENDVNCGILAEHLKGAAKPFKNVVGFFVGTGLGGGIIINGELYRGARGLAGELGHETIKFNGRKCGCGKRGCLEAYCSKTAFAKKLRKIVESKKGKTVLSKTNDAKFKNLKSSDLAKAYFDGDELVREVLEDGFYMLGLATANIVSILDPECVVYGGGVVEALGGSIIKPITQGFSENLFGKKSSDTCLVISELGDDAVPMGAMINAKMRGKI